jgi:large subunit ribosomal protein L25
MKTIAIEGSLRENLGGSSAKQLRKEGQVPCVIYGGEENIHFYTPENSFKNLLYTPEVYNVEIALDGKKYNCVIRQAQYHAVTDQVEHIDFLELLPKKEVMIRVPVVLKGNARGVRNGGRLKVNLRRLRVKAIPSGLPGQIEIDITDLKIGDTIRVEDIPVDGFIIDHEPTRAICLIQTARNVVEEVEEEEEGEEGEEGATAEAAEGEAPAEEAPAEG